MEHKIKKGQVNIKKRAISGKLVGKSRFGGGHFLGICQWFWQLCGQTGKEAFELPEKFAVGKFFGSEGLV
jgi:hypothetical protein